MKDSCKVCFLDSQGNVLKNMDFSKDSSDVSLSIRADDTIETVKQNILYGAQKYDLGDFSLEEMYLFVVIHSAVIKRGWKEH